VSNTLDASLLRVPVVDPKTGVVTREWRLQFKRMLSNVNVSTALTTDPVALTASVNPFTPTLSGAVPASGGGATNFLNASGQWVTPAYPTAAAPTGKVGTVAANGNAATFMRSDAAPPIDQTIVPIWTATHTFTNAVPLILANASSVQAQNASGTAVAWFTFNASNIQRFGDYSNAYAAELSGTIVTLRYGAAVAGLTLSSAGVACTVPVKTPSYATAALPSASAAGAGARALVTDANATTFLSTVAGGGSNIVPVVSNGTNWVIG